MQIRLRVLKCYVWSTLLYACETWTLKVAMMNRLEGFEMWCYRRMLRIPWTDRVENERVLERLQTERTLLSTIKRRKLEYFGHMIRGPKYRPLQIIMQGKVEGKRPIGRKNLSWLRNIRTWCGLNVEELFRIATNREDFRMLVDGLLRSETNTRP